LIGGAAICCIQEPKQPAAQRFGAGLSVAAGAHHRPIRPRGTFDIMARLIGQWLTEKLGQPFVIENRPGAGGNIGTEAVVRAPADGYALLLVGTANAISVTLYEKLNFNFIRDIVPVAGIARVPVNPSLPATTVRELIAYAKANAGKLTMASGGIGTLSHLASPSSALFRRERDRGEPPMLNASVRPSALAVFKIDHEFVLGRHLHRKIGGLLALEDAINVAGGLSVLVSKINPVEISPPAVTKKCA
jgi:Tripartite tricarboxylate transporter family receptor